MGTKYLAWKGNRIVESEMPNEVQVCTALQFRLALNKLGLRQVVEDYIATANQDVKDYWEFGMDFTADHPLVVATATTLGITNDQLSALFAAGVKINSKHTAPAKSTETKDAPPAAEATRDTRTRGGRSG